MSAEAAVAELVGKSMAGETVQDSVEPAVHIEEPDCFDFDADFQKRIVYLVAYDQTFMRRVAHLLQPEYFENEAERAFVHLAQIHWKAYQSVLGSTDVMALAIKDAFGKKLIRKDAIENIKGVIKELLAVKAAMQSGEAVPLNAEFVADQIASFAQVQACIQAVSRSVDLIEKRDFAAIQKLITEAAKVGLDEAEAGGDYFERLAVRTNERADTLSGKMPPRGITTGHPKLDALLYHRGWGRKELTILMGGAKAGKTTALIEFASAAVMAGKNVLYVTLEVSNRIIEERADARFSDTPISSLVSDFGTVNDKLSDLAMRGSIGKFYIAEFPSGSLSPSGLRALLERHKAKGWIYDMVVLDYADLMRPDFRTNDVIENSKQVYVDLRAIGQEWNVAMLTATQSNREGYKSVTAKAEHVSEDFNKVRTADLFITINSTEEERRDNKARLYFAASRNQQSGMTIFIQQDFGRGRFLKLIERIE